MRDLEKEPIRLGIIGAGGFVERRILPALQQVSTLKAVCLQKRDLQAARYLAERFGVNEVVSSPAELLAKNDVEAVLIASANHLHEEQALAAAAAGKPTLCEKPLAPTVKAIERMIAAFGTIPFMVGHSLRFKPAVQLAKKALQEGTLGCLSHINLYFSLPVPAKSWRHSRECGGGVLQDIGVHLVDLIHFISGEDIVDVTAMTNKKEVAETASVLARLSSGAVATFHCSFHEPLRSGFDVVGSRGILSSQKSLRQTDEVGEKLFLLEEDIPVLLANIYVEELKHFAAVLAGETESLIPAAIALKNQKIIEALV